MWAYLQTWLGRPGELLMMAVIMLQLRALRRVVDAQGSGLRALEFRTVDPKNPGSLESRLARLRHHA